MNDSIYALLPKLPTGRCYWDLKPSQTRSYPKTPCINIVLVDQTTDTILNFRQVILNTLASYSDPESSDSQILRNAILMAAENIMNNEETAKLFKKWHDDDLAEEAMAMLLGKDHTPSDRPV